MVTLSPLSKCRACGLNKTRVRSTRRRQKSRFYYVDENGKLWNGLQCPQCKLYGASGHRAGKDKEETSDDTYIYC